MKKKRWTFSIFRGKKKKILLLHFTVNEVECLKFRFAIVLKWEIAILHLNSMEWKKHCFRSKQFSTKHDRSPARIINQEFNMKLEMTYLFFYYFHIFYLCSCNLSNMTYTRSKKNLMRYSYNFLFHFCSDNLCNMTYTRRKIIWCDIHEFTFSFFLLVL